MGKPKAKLEDQKVEKIEYEVIPEMETAEENPIGIPLVSEMKSEKIVDVLKIPLGYKRESVIDDNKEVVHIRFGIPANIDPDVYYLASEWRISPDDMLDVDYEPQWKKMGLIVDGVQIMAKGRPVLVAYYIMKAEQEVDDEHAKRLVNGSFALVGPFSDVRMKMSDFGLPVMKGHDINAIAEAKRILGNQYSNSARMRRET